MLHDYEMRKNERIDAVSRANIPPERRQELLANVGEETLRSIFQELLLQSRAMDETGYVQPTKEQLREVRGENSIYHNNCIQTWWVRPNGEAENVEVS